MDSYRLTLTVIAVLVLIGILTFLGLQMRTASSQAPFPPTAHTCPDFWTTNVDGTCTAGSKNTGKFSSGYTFDPSASLVNGLSFACSMKDWSGKTGVVWDGYSNFNQC